MCQPTEEVDHPIHVREHREEQNPQQPGAIRGTQNGLMGPQDIPPLVAVVSRYPDLLVELPVKVFQSGTQGVARRCSITLVTCNRIVVSWTEEDCRSTRG